MKTRQIFLSPRYFCLINTVNIVNFTRRQAVPVLVHFRNEKKICILGFLKECYILNLDLKFIK